MTRLYALRVFSNGQPSTLYITGDTSYNLYVDTQGGKEIQFHYGAVSIPIESISHYTQYEKLPSVQLQRYFNALISAVHDGSISEAIICDTCYFQQKYLTMYWNYWKEKGYVSDSDPLPLPLAVMGMFKEPEKKNRWF